MGRRLTGHLSVQKGKRVIVVFKDGSRAEDKFIEKKGKYVHLKELGKVANGTISTLMIAR